MTIPNTPQRLLRAALLACFLTLPSLPSARSEGRPPTLDPTYGLPLPKLAHAPAIPVSAAQWIWAGTTADNQTVILRRVFDLPRRPKTATLYLTADDFFTLSVNGRPVDQSQADSHDANVWQHVHRVDIAPYLTAGANVLAVQARNAQGAAGMVARLDLPHQRPVVTDAGWRVAPAALAPDGWTRADFDSSGWQPATVIAPVTGGVWAGAGGLTGWPGYDRAVPYLAHLTLPAVRVLNVHLGAGKMDGADKLAGHRKAVLTVTPPPADAANPPSLLLDFGEEVAGRVQVEPLTAGVVQIGTGESLAEAVNAPWGGLHRLTLAPGASAFTPYSAFRYARLVFPASASVARAPVRLRVMLDDKYYPVEYKGAFSCSDPLLTKIWYTGAYTAHLCMQEDIWDAPKRDRARWSGDLHVSGRVIDTVFADKFLMEQTMERLRGDAQGGQPAGAPPKDDVNSIPGYSCAWICTLADFQRHVGDAAYLARQHKALLSLLAYMQGETDNRGLFANTRGHWPFTDWSPGFDGDTPESRAATHLFYVRAARDAMFLLKEMGDKPNAVKYAAWADTLTQSGRNYLFDAATGTYGRRLQENAMAIYSGAATPAQAQVIAQTILSPGSAAWDKTGMPPYNSGVISPYYSNYVLYALSLAGHTEDALRVLRLYWSGMRAEGATTFWEAYDPALAQAELPCEFVCRRQPRLLHQPLPRLVFGADKLADRARSRRSPHQRRI